MTRYENNGIILSDKLKACVSSAPMFFHCSYTVYRVNRKSAMPQRYWHNSTPQKMRRKHISLIRSYGRPDTSPHLTKNYEYIENVCTCDYMRQNVILTAA